MWTFRVDAASSPSAKGRKRMQHMFSQNGLQREGHLETHVLKLEEQVQVQESALKLLSNGLSHCNASFQPEHEASPASKSHTHINTIPLEIICS